MTISDIMCKNLLAGADWQHVASSSRHCLFCFLTNLFFNQKASASDQRADPVPFLCFECPYGLHWFRALPFIIHLFLVSLSLYFFSSLFLSVKNSKASSGYSLQESDLAPQRAQPCHVYVPCPVGWAFLGLWSTKIPVVVFACEEQQSFSVYAFAGAIESK